VRSSGGYVPDDALVSETVFLGLGSNLGTRLAHLRRATWQLNEIEGLEVRAVSPVYASIAHTKSHEPDMGDFLNVVVRLTTVLDPNEVLNACLSVEASAGRKREVDRWLPRTIDIDILAFGDRTIENDRLTIPHPRLAERLFVLLPFADLAPDVWIPRPFSATVKELLATCRDPLGIKRRYPAAVLFNAGGQNDGA